jgi:hypothetical protein
MTEPIFVDTSVLIYALDEGNLNKYWAGRAWRAELRRSRRGRISYQVFEEFTSLDETTVMFRGSVG